MWERQYLTTLQASVVYYEDIFTFLLLNFSCEKQGIFFLKETINAAYFSGSAPVS
jgi:hypothetical protein